MTGLVMLAVLYMLIVRAGEPNMWRWFAGNDRPRRLPAEQQSRSRRLRRLPEATGPTDEDPDQAEEAREEFQALTDGTLKLGPEEMCLMTVWWNG